ncbi:hypothetical protein ILUMI_10649 [Ignelater luminosus]|uniref:Uncharacterized protein n=1 Tax=Ignelater luminosus TaxID=2038154 RepID=A0A8K0D1Q2_IGNLU|nr:hypothetical protein ILUMI_10649 [Ignelater luminosus]
MEFLTLLELKIKEQRYDVTFYIWNFNSPATIHSLTIKNCDTLRLSFTCSSENKPIQWLKIQNIRYLEILQPTVSHNPPQIYFENIGHVETIPRHTFVQIKKTVHKPSCVVPANDLNGIFFKNVHIGTIETEAFKNLTDMKQFSWFNVSVARINLNAIYLSFENGARGSMDKCTLEVVEPIAMRIIGEGFTISRGTIGALWGSGINGTIYEFRFSNNTVGTIQANGIAILALNVEIVDNTFQMLESGAFQKISPGLLHDSRRNFGKLMFSYKFSNNVLQHVEDGGIRPDIIAYKNVAAEVIFSYNTLQCSCEGLTWLGADVDLGYGFSVLKDFNTMILDPRNSNMCTFTPSTVRVSFEKCGTKGFTCETSKEISNKVDVVYQCANNTGHGQDITFYVWSFNSPGTITSLTIKNCETLRLSFTCTGENKPIQWLKIQNITYLEIMPAAIANHNPPQIYLENVSFMETLPRDTFTQVKRTAYKPGCINPVNDLNGIFFKNVNIGTIETEAFKTLIDMRNFSWYNVSVKKVNLNAIHLTFEDGARAYMNKCNLDIVEPMGIRITGDGLSITRGRVGNMWGSGINGTIYDFAFNNNTVCNIQSGAISILALNVEMVDNDFQSIESGAFQKISPGLLHDSRRNFGTLMFSYKFSNNLVQRVEDGGIKPDIIAYKNVAAEVTYTDNTLQCSCEGLTWLGADVDLGYGYSVLKDFNTMILDPPNKNKCTFTPCMCFGVRSPNKKSTAAASVF